MRRGLEGGFDPAHLPPVARELADVIGLPALLALVEWCGGLRLSVPAVPTAEMLERFGSVAAERLCGRFAGERLVIPKCDAAVRAARDAQLRERYAAGVQAATLAVDYGLTLRQVWRILACDPGGRASAAERGRQQTLL